MQSKIPPAIREQLSEDPFMKKCVIDDSTCEGRIEWNHAFTYKGKRVNELWSLIPQCHHHHDMTRSVNVKWHVEEAMRDRIIFFGASKDFKEKYPRSNLVKIRLKTN